MEIWKSTFSNLMTFIMAMKAVGKAGSIGKFTKLYNKHCLSQNNNQCTTINIHNVLK